MRHRAGARARSAGGAARHRRLPSRRQRCRAAGAGARRSTRSPCPQCGAHGTARDRRVGYLPRLGVVLPALPVGRSRRRRHGSGADAQVAAGRHLHRRQRARRAAPDVHALHHHGAARHRAAAVRGAVQEVPRPRPDHQGRREDVEVARQRRQSRTSISTSTAPTSSACT